MVTTNLNMSQCKESPSPPRSKEDIMANKQASQINTYTLHTTEENA